MTEKNEHTKEIENNTTEQHIEIETETTTEQINEQKQPKINTSWMKKINKQTIIVALLFFVLGGVTATSISGSKHHSKGKHDNMAFNKEQKNKDKKDKHSFGNNSDNTPNDLNGKKETKHLEDDNDTTTGASKSEKKRKNKDFSDEKSEKKNR